MVIKHWYITNDDGPYMTYKVCVPLDYRGPSHCVVSSNERFPHMQTWKHTYNTHMQTCWTILT